MFCHNYEGKTVSGMLEQMARQYGAQPLFTWKRGGEVRSVSYRHFFQDVQRLAAAFDAAGLRGQPVVISGRNSYEQTVALFAAPSMGAVAAPLCFDLALEDLQDLLRRISPAALVCDEMDEELLPELPLPESCRVFPCEEGAGSVAGLLEADGALHREQGGSPEDPALLLATSGSTSRSKLVLLSHAGLLPHAEFSATRRAAHLLPMYHSASLCALTAFMAQGSEICLSSIGRGMEDIAWFRPENMLVVPSFAALLARQSRLGKADLSCFCAINTGGAQQEEATTAYLEGLGIFSGSLYGATETAGSVDYALPGRYRAGSVGVAGPWNEVRVSPQGEILVKGKNVMLRYLDDPEATAQAMEDGWYHTGDLGYLDGDGFLFITGRIKNIIILSNGENVSPEAVENKLSACPAIAEVVVRGEEDRIAAHIWCGPKDGEALRAQVEKFISRYNRTVPSYHAVRRVEFRDAPFEKTASGKIKRG